MAVTIEIPDTALQEATQAAIRARVERVLDLKVEEALRSASAVITATVTEESRHIPTRIRAAVEKLVFASVDAKRDAILQAVEKALGTPEKVEEMVRQKIQPAVDQILRETVRRLTGRAE